MATGRLSIPLIRRLHRRLERRHRATGDRGLLAVGLGWATKEGRYDPARGLVLLYIVRRKKKKPRREHRIARNVSVVLHGPRTGRRRRLTFQTDVIELSHAVQTGARLDNGYDNFTSGALVSWGAGAERSWGLLTVGHGVEPSPLAAVTVTLQYMDPFQGHVFAYTRASDTLDAALITIEAVNAAAILAAISPNGPTYPTCRSLDQLVQDGNTEHPTGYSLSQAGAAQFSFTGFVAAQNPNSPLLDQAPYRTNLLLVQGGPDVFDHGTSGSVWEADNSLIDGIQLAADRATFSRGFGQPMVDYLNWAEGIVNSPVTLCQTF